MALTLHGSTGITGAGIGTIGPSGANITGIVTATSAKVGTAVTISESGINATGVGITVASINEGPIGGRRNIIINGACNVAQRGTSDTSDVQGYTTVDRFKIGWGGADAIIETHQESLSSSDTGPWAEGFRNAYKLVNGNQSSGAGAGDYAEIQYKAEAQDMASSGWNYTSTTDYVTLSFWVKSSVAQNYYGFLTNSDGTSQRYIFETGSLSSNTWKKVILTIPGATNVQFDNDTGEGLIIKWIPFYGTDFTASATLNTWAAYSGSARTPDNTSTWWTTNDATFHLTGIQLERGSVTTPFEHRSFGEELSLCQRYYYRATADTSDDFGSGFNSSTTQCRPTIVFPVTMRNAISAVETTGTASDYKVAHGGTETNCSAVPTYSGGSKINARCIFTVSSGLTAGQGSAGRSNAAGAYLGFNAEL